MLGGHDGAGAQRAGDEHDRRHGQAQHRLVGHQLGAGPNRTEQRVLRSRRPAGQHHAVDRDARHHQEEENPPRRVGQLQAGGVAGDGDGPADGHDGEYQQGREQHEVGSGPVDDLVRAPGCEGLLEQQLGAVGEGLEPAVGPGPVGPVADAEPGHRLALIHDHEEHGHHDDGEDRHHLDQQNDPDSQIEAVVEDRITHRVTSLRRHRDLGKQVPRRRSGRRPGRPGGSRPARPIRTAGSGHRGPGSTSRPRAELTRTASPSAIPIAASTDGCTRRRASGCSPARAGTAWTWVPPSQRVRRLTRRRAPGLRAASAGRTGPVGPPAAAAARHGRPLRHRFFGVGLTPEGDGGGGRTAGRGRFHGGPAGAGRHAGVQHRGGRHRVQLRRGDPRIGHRIERPRVGRRARALASGRHNHAVAGAPAGQRLVGHALVQG